MIAFIVYLPVWWAVIVRIPLQPLASAIPGVLGGVAAAY
jgi:hypothetical protein